MSSNRNVIQIFVLIIVLNFTGGSNELPKWPTKYDLSGKVMNKLADELSRLFTNELLTYMKINKKSFVLNLIFKGLAVVHSKKDYLVSDFEHVSPQDYFFLCVLCRTGVNVTMTYFKDPIFNATDQTNSTIVKELILEICELTNFASAETCSNLFDSNWPTIFEVFNGTKIDAETICSLLLQHSYCNTKNLEPEWKVDMEMLPEITEDKNDNLKKSLDDIYIVHISDIHYDPQYQELLNANCDEPVCCRNGNLTTDDAAGFWGDYYNCDTPWRLVKQIINYISVEMPNVKYIYNTGDVVTHMSFNLGKEKFQKTFEKVYNEFVNQFSKTRIFSCLGAHDTFPSNIFSPKNAADELSTYWVYEKLAKYTEKFLSVNKTNSKNRQKIAKFKDNSDDSKHDQEIAEVKETILKSGYYTYMPQPNLRIIVLNNLECYVFNWWLYDVGHKNMTQLQWLYDTIAAAEQNEEFVHIIQHLPPGSSACWSAWSEVFNDIVFRFYKTISAIFYGHTHLDNIKLAYAGKENYAVNIAFDGGSLTPYNKRNPSFRVYRVETKSFQVVGIETYAFDLKKANERGLSKASNINIKSLYTFQAVFTENISPAGINILFDTFILYPAKLRLFYFYQYTYSEIVVNKGCARECMMSTICDSVLTNNENSTKCKELQVKLDISIEREEEEEAENKTDILNSATLYYRLSPSKSFIIFFYLNIFMVTYMYVIL